MMLSLAFCCARHHRGGHRRQASTRIALRQLVDLPADWTNQRGMLGLT